MVGWLNQLSVSDSHPTDEICQHNRRFTTVTFRQPVVTDAVRGVEAEKSFCEEWMVGNGIL